MGGLDLQGERELGEDAERVDPRVAAELADERAEPQPPAVPDHSVVGHDPPDPFPVLLRERAGERCDGSLSFAARGLAGGEATVPLGENRGALVRVEMDQRAQLPVGVHLRQPQKLALEGSFARVARVADAIERDALSERADRLPLRAASRPLPNHLEIPDPELDVAAEQREAAAVLEHEVATRERAQRRPVPRLETFLDAREGARRGVRGDAQRIGTQRREARPRELEVLDFVELHGGRAIAPEDPEPHVHALESAAARGERPEHVCDVEHAVGGESQHVEGLDEQVRRLLEERGQRLDERRGAFDPAEPGAPPVVEEEVLGQHGAEPFEVAIEDGADRCGGARRIPLRRLTPEEALAQLGASRTAVRGIEGDDRGDATLCVHLDDGQRVRLDRPASVRAGEVKLPERQPVPGGREQRRRHASLVGPQHPGARDEQVAIAAQENAAVPVVEHHRRRARRGKPVPIPGLARLLQAIGRARRRVRRDAQRIAPPVLEHSARAVEILELEELRPDEPAVLVAGEADEERLERAPLSERSEHAADAERGVLRHRDVVERVRRHVGGHLPHSGVGGDVLVGVADSTDARTAVVVEGVAVGEGGAHAGEVMSVRCARESDQRSRREARALAPEVALRHLDAGGPLVVGVEADQCDEAPLGIHLDDLEVLHFASVARPQQALEREASPGRREHRACDAGRSQLGEQPTVREERVPVPADEIHAAPILVDELPGAQRFEGGPIARGEGPLPALEEPRGRVRGDPQGIGRELRGAHGRRRGGVELAHRLEARPRLAEPLELVLVEAAHAPSGVELRDHQARLLEPTSVARADPDRDDEIPARCERHVVEAHPGVGRELDERTQRRQVRGRAVERLPAETPVIGNDEIRGAERGEGFPVPALEGAREGAHRPGGRSEGRGLTGVVARVELGVRGFSGTGVEHHDRDGPPRGVALDHGEMLVLESSAAEGPAEESAEEREALPARGEQLAAPLARSGVEEDAEVGEERAAGEADAHEGAAVVELGLRAEGCQHGVPVALAPAALQDGLGPGDRVVEARQRGRGQKIVEARERGARVGGIEMFEVREQAVVSEGPQLDVLVLEGTAPLALDAPDRAARDQPIAARGEQLVHPAADSVGDLVEHEISARDRARAPGPPEAELAVIRELETR